MTEPHPSRRIVFSGLSALGTAAALAGCGRDTEAPRGAPPTTSPRDGSSGTASATSSPEPSASSSPPAQVLATTDEIPVEGGIVLTDVRVVITQPRVGEFQAFSAVCTHQGETVSVIEDNVIRCTAHGSDYDAKTGDVVGGPAPARLAPIRIEVTRGRITRA